MKTRNINTWITFLLGGNELKRMKKTSVIYPFLNEQSPFCTCLFCHFFSKRNVVTFEVISQLFCSSDLFPLYPTGKKGGG